MKKGKKNEDFSLIASTIISKNQNVNQNMSQLPMKGKYIIILEQTFDIVAKKNKKHKTFNKFNFNKSFSLNHSYISDISSSEISKLKRNLINQKSMIKEKRNKSEFNVNHIQIQKEEKNLNKSKSLGKEINWSIKNNIDNTFLDNSTLQMMQDLNIDKEKDIKNDKKETEKKQQKKSKSPVKKEENKSKSKSPVNKKKESKSKSPIIPKKKESTKSPTEAENKKRIPITLKKNEFVIKKDTKDNNKFRTAAQKIQYTPIKKKEVSKRKSNQSSFLREKEKPSFIKEKESNQTTFLDKSIQTNIKKKKKKPQKDEQSVVHSEDFQASSEYTATENENKHKHYKKIIPHRKYKRESKQSGQSTNNEIINEGKQEQSFFEKSSSLCSSNRLPFKPIIPKSKLYAYQKRSTSTGQCDQKSTPSSISGCGTPFPRNASKKTDKSYITSTSFLQNRLVQTAKAGTTRNFEQNEQLFEINERKKINSSKVRINKNVNPTFENNADLEESKCRKHLPRGPRVPFSNISQEYIDRKKQMFMELMKDPSNPYSLYWTDRFLNKNYNMNTFVKGTVNCVPNIGLMVNNNPNNSFMHLTPNDCFFDRTQRNQIMMENELNDINIPDISYIGAGYSQPLPKKLNKSGSARLVQYPSIYKYFNSNYVY